MLSIILLALTFSLNTRSQDSIPTLLTRLDNAIEASSHSGDTALMGISIASGYGLRQPLK